LSRIKRTLVRSALIAFTIWPALHIALVKLYDVNPWKLAGWGMYSAPQLPSLVEVTGLTPDSVGRYPLRTIQPELAPVLDDFLLLRRHLGRVIEPADFARALLDYYPAIDGVEIVVVEPVLDLRSGMIVERRDRYEYLRADPES
jgi:hypothetical protein